MADVSTVPGGDVQPSQIVFLHIAKTAGTSFTNYLQGHFAPHEVAPPYLGDITSIAARRGGWRLFWGHMTHRVISPVLPLATYLTFLRDPVARTVSQYKSWHEPRNLTIWGGPLTAGQIAAIRFAQEATLSEFLLSDDPQILGAIVDHQTGCLASAEFGSPDFLASAMENLERRVAVFGLTEFFDQSVALMRRSIPFLGPYSLPGEAENRSRQDGLEMTEEARSRLLDLTVNDRALYRFARLLFDERLKGAAPMPSFACLANSTR